MAADPIHSRLQLWQDANADGRSNAGELVSLAQAGVMSISLSSVPGSGPDGSGNVVQGWTTVAMADGSMLSAADLGLAYNPDDLGAPQNDDIGPMPILTGDEFDALQLLLSGDGSAEQDPVPSGPPTVDHAQPGEAAMEGVPEGRQMFDLWVIP